MQIVDLDTIIFIFISLFYCILISSKVFLILDDDFLNVY